MRHFAYLLAGYVGLVLMSTLLSLLPFRVLAPDLVLALLCVVALARQPVVPGLLLAFALGYLTDLFTGAPKGLHVEALGVVFLTVRLLAIRMQVQGGPSLMALVFCAALLESGLVALLCKYTGLDGPTLGPLAASPGQSLVTALFAPVVAAVLQRIDRAVGTGVNPGGARGNGGRGFSLGAERDDRAGRLDFKS
jgi:rod shape-determining protein MreD